MHDREGDSFNPCGLPRNKQPDSFRANQSPLPFGRVTQISPIFPPTRTQPATPKQDR